MGTADQMKIGVVVLGLLAIVYLLKKKGAPGDLGAAVGGAAVEAAGGVVAGGALTIGDWLNLPRTEMSACEAAKAAGDTWEASFVCPAGDFLSYVWR